MFVRTLKSAALTVLATFALVGVAHVSDQPAPASQPASWSQTDGQRADAKVVCSLTRPQWRGLCQRVWVRPEFTWVSYGQRVTDQAGPLLVIDALHVGPRSAEFASELRGWDADYRDFVVWTAEQAAKHHRR